MLYKITALTIVFICNDMQVVAKSMSETDIVKLFKVSSLYYPLGTSFKCINIRDNYDASEKRLVRVSNIISGQRRTIGDKLELKTEYIYGLEIKYGFVENEIFRYFNGDIELKATEFRSLPVESPIPGNPDYDILLEAYNDRNIPLIEQYKQMRAYARSTPIYSKQMNVYINCDIDKLDNTIASMLLYTAVDRPITVRNTQPRFVMPNYNRIIVEDIVAKHEEVVSVSILSPDYVASTEIKKYLCITGVLSRLAEQNADIPIILCIKLWNIIRYSGKFKGKVVGEYTSEKFSILRECLTELGISLNTGINPIEELIDKLTSIIFEPYKELADRYDTVSTTDALEKVKPTMTNLVNHIDLPIDGSISMCMISLVEGYQQLLESSHDDRKFVTTYMQRFCLGHKNNDIELISITPNQRFTIPLLYENMVEFISYPPLMTDYEWKSFVSGTYKWKDINYKLPKDVNPDMFELGQKCMRKFMLNPISEEEFRMKILTGFMNAINDGTNWRYYDIVVDNEQKPKPRSKTILELCITDVFSNTPLIETLRAYSIVV